MFSVSPVRANALLLVLLLGLPAVLIDVHSCLAAPPPAKRKSAPDISPAYRVYLERLRAKVSNFWDYPDGKNHVVLQATIASDGTVGDVLLKSTPESKVAEQAANTAFSQAQPLEPLPAGGTPTARLTLVFDSNADPHGDSTVNLTGRLDPIVPAPAQPAAR